MLLKNIFEKRRLENGENNSEFCQNHNGSRDIMAQMVEEAKQAGATYTKATKYFRENLTFRPQFENGLFRNNETINKTTI